MTLRRISFPLAALLALGSLPLVLGAGRSAASASPGADGSLVALAAPLSDAGSMIAGSQVPAARGDDNGPGDGMNGPGKEEAKPEPKPEPCPVELWNLSVPVEGVACVLLLPKSEKKEEPKEEKPGAPKPKPGQ